MVIEIPFLPSPDQICRIFGDEKAYSAFVVEDPCLLQIGVGTHHSIAVHFKLCSQIPHGRNPVTRLQ